MAFPASLDLDYQASPEAALRAEQAKLLYRSPFLILINLINAPVTAALLWRVYAPRILLGWVGLFVVVVGARMLLWWRFQGRRTDRDPHRAWVGWSRAFAAGTFLTGCLWGLLGSVVFVTDDPAYYVIAVFVVGGMTAGASLRDSAYLPAFYGFAAAAILPLLAAIVAKGTPLLLEMGLLIATFGGALILIGRSNSRWFAENIHLRIEQAARNRQVRLMAADLEREAVERERFAARLQESAERLRGIGESAQDAIIVTDADGAVVYWNAAAERIFGYAAAEMEGRVFHEILPAQRYRKAALAGYRQFAKTGEGAILGKITTVEAVRKDGSEFPIDLSISAMRVGEAWSALGIARDVSERKKAEAVLREREAELRDAQRLAHLGSWVWTAKDDSNTWSDELYRLFGLDPATHRPSMKGLETLMTPESYARMGDAFATCQRTGTPYEIDLELVRADGSGAWVSARGEAERDPAGRIVRIRGTVQDITERKLAERNITGLHQQMSDNVSALLEHERDMTVIAKLSDILQACQSRAEAYPIIAASAHDLFRDSAGALAIVANGTRELETVAQWGAGEAMSAAFSFDDCWALRTGQRYDVTAPDDGALCRHFKTPPPGAYICLPLAVRGEIVGLLYLNLAAGRVIDANLHRLMSSFGDVVKLSLSNLRLREVLSEQAIRDQLTTLFNRHYLMETLPREIRRAERDHTTLTVAMIDIDHFKAFNDTHGHDAGDLVLRELSAYFRGALRAGDIACRYGGEEILVVMPECDVASAQMRVERMRQDLKRKQMVFHGQLLPNVTVSVGLAEFSDQLDTTEGLIAAADRALYAAKRNGRDRIEVFTSELPEPARATSA